LREVIAAYISRTRGHPGGAERVCVVLAASRSVLHHDGRCWPGDEVVYPNPGFPIYESMINFLGATGVPIPLIEDRGFSFDWIRSKRGFRIAPRCDPGFACQFPPRPVPAEDIRRMGRGCSRRART